MGAVPGTNRIVIEWRKKTSCQANDDLKPPMMCALNIRASALQQAQWFALFEQHTDAEFLILLHKFLRMAPELWFLTLWVVTVTFISQDRQPLWQDPHVTCPSCDKQRDSETERQTHRGVPHKASVVRNCRMFLCNNFARQFCATTLHYNFENCQINLCDSFLWQFFTTIFSTNDSELHPSFHVFPFCVSKWSTSAKKVVQTAPRFYATISHDSFTLQFCTAILKIVGQIYQTFWGLWGTPQMNDALTNTKPKLSAMKLQIRNKRAHNPMGKHLDQVVEESFEEQENWV